jgi:phosphoribosylformylglycinamidine cyclo-ligase
MVAVVAPEDADRVLAVLTARHVPAWVLGEVAKGDDGVRAELVGNHPRF